MVHRGSCQQLKSRKESTEFQVCEKNAGGGDEPWWILAKYGAVTSQYSKFVAIDCYE